MELRLAKLAHSLEVIVMKNSDNRLDYIAAYIGAYEKKIELLNSCGLFDSAKLFELFAVEVGSLIFKQRLTNLNTIKKNYPYVDLISEDGTFYVQVSTTMEMFDKIKYTLRKIEDSRDDEIRQVKKVKFIFLSNSSVDKVCNLTGDSKIGEIEFIKEEDLITTHDILAKAQSDLDFQIKLYNLLRKEEETIQTNLSKLENAFANSKVGLGTIECKINGEYEIDRSSVIAQISEKFRKNLCICGRAGSGKTVSCKKLIEKIGVNEVLYARAERFLEETDINSVWGFNIRETFKRLDNRLLIIFIDSLEFIADNKSKLDLLRLLYDCAKDYDNIKIITTCRASDKNSFIELESKYEILSYEIGDLSSDELNDIAKQYSIVRSLMTNNNYEELLKSPFYIDVITKYVLDFDNINDENQFREYIWDNVICKRGAEFREAINSIVFTRAKDMSVGVPMDNYDIKVIQQLISDGILIRNARTIRIKYDIFEDICFEQWFNKIFDECRGNYNDFFETIKQLGSCSYRRYQIWIENKLLCKTNREKFLYNLVFSNLIPVFWKEQTQIGLVKSRFSKSFFEEYGRDIIDKNLFSSFVYLANLYAFDVKVLEYNAKQLLLIPCGAGRESLIHLAATNNSYSFCDVQSGLIKLCDDYAKGINCNNETSQDVLKILSGLLESRIKLIYEKDWFDAATGANSILASIYALAKYTSGWINDFWQKMLDLYKSGVDIQTGFARDIIEYALKAQHCNLAVYMPRELCELAEAFWTYDPKLKLKYNGLATQCVNDNPIRMYGLSLQASNYEYKSNAKEGTFFKVLFKYNFGEGLKWAIHFVNYAVDSFYKCRKNEVAEYKIKFFDSHTEKRYIGNPNMWLSTTMEHSMPLLISDIIYFLKCGAAEIISQLKKNNRDYKCFAHNLKQTLFEQANNIALLTVIAEIGMIFENDLPGYALDLFSNIDFVMLDILRQTHLIKPDSVKMLEKYILQVVGIPYGKLKRRYVKFIPQTNLKDYFIRLCLSKNPDVVNRAEQIINYLYSVIPNDKSHAEAYLQIQHMDVKNFKISGTDGDYITLEASVTGAAKELVKNYEHQNRADEEISELINEVNSKIKDNTSSCNYIVATIDRMMSLMKKSKIQGTHDMFLITLISYALIQPRLDREKREFYCKYWVEGIRKILNGDSFVFDIKLTFALLDQIKQEMSADIKNQLKEMMLECILYRGQNGVVYKITDVINNYLYQDVALSAAMFNTIIKLAENKEKYKQHYASQESENNTHFGLRKKIQSEPDTDYYVDQEEHISELNASVLIKYLYNEEPLDLVGFNIDDYDIGLISHALNCKETICDGTFVAIVKQYFSKMIDLFEDYGKDYSFYDIINVNQLVDVQALCKRTLLSDVSAWQSLLDLMFDDVNYSKFNRHTIEFYQNVFGCILPFYFDSFNKPLGRAKCEQILKALELKIKSIDQSNVKSELYKLLIMPITNRFAGASDWSKCQTSYTYKDIQFLNSMFGNYGGYHLGELIEVVYMLHVDKLLPWILTSLNDACDECISLYGIEEFKKIVKTYYPTVMYIIGEAYVDFNDKIKEDRQCVEGFEGILEKLKTIECSEAAVILDEFRIH